MTNRNGGSNMADRDSYLKVIFHNLSEKNILIYTGYQFFFETTIYFIILNGTHIYYLLDFWQYCEKIC